MKTLTKQEAIEAMENGFKSHLEEDTTHLFFIENGILKVLTPTNKVAGAEVKPEWFNSLPSVGWLIYEDEKGHAKKDKKTIKLVDLGNPTLDDSFEITNHILRELQTKKEQVVKDKFSEKGFAHLLENIDKRRFKKVAIEHFEDCEKWYADDGTDEGVLIVTFLIPEPRFTNNINGEFKITTEIKYY